MTLPSSGALSLSQIQSEFGGSNPINLSEYYRGGSLVPAHGNTTGIPSSGQISVSQFYGKSNTAPGVSSYSWTITVGSAGTNFGYIGNTGSISNNPMSVSLTTGLRVRIDSAYWGSLCSKAQFYFVYTVLAGPTNGTGWSSVSTSFNGNMARSGFTISASGSQVTCNQIGSVPGSPPSSGTQTFTMFA